jgi:virginiamycin A acetyltransferase
MRDADPSDIALENRGPEGRTVFKRVLNLIAIAIVSPAALVCGVERRISPQTFRSFQFWTHVFAIVPGLPGMFLRRAFYRWTLEQCAEDVTIEFGVLFSRRNAILESGVYIGPFALIGSVWIQRNSLIGSRASLLSGGQQHEMLASGQWSATDEAKLTRIVVGPNTWVGEGAILMAGTGEGSMVAAGAVVSTAVPPRTMVGGNPARFVRRVTADAAVNDVAAKNVTAKVEAGIMAAHVR